MLLEAQPFAVRREQLFDGRPAGPSTEHSLPESAFTLSASPNIRDGAASAHAVRSDALFSQAPFCDGLFHRPCRVYAIDG